jgi:hypothetical protein
MGLTDGFAIEECDQRRPVPAASGRMRVVMQAGSETGAPWQKKMPIVPLRTAWDRLGPDKFFSPRENGGKNCRSGLWWSFAETQSVGVCRFVPLCAASQKPRALGLPKFGRMSSFAVSNDGKST